MFVQQLVLERPLRPYLLHVTCVKQSIQTAVTVRLSGRLSLQCGHNGFNHSDDSGVSVSRLAYHQVCGGRYYPLGEEQDAAKHMFTLVVPECQQSRVTAAKSFPLLLPHSQQCEDSWTMWCKQQNFVSAAAVPRRFFQTALFNVAKSTRVHSKKADVLEQALIILHACILEWLAARVAGNRTACPVICPEEADMQHLSTNHQAALLARFAADVDLLTGMSAVRSTDA